MAQNIAAVDTSGINLVYKINNKTCLVGGPSAGAALTMATLAVLKDMDLNN